MIGETFWPGTSMYDLKHFHMLFGLAALATFLATGVYMRTGLGRLEELEPLTRLLYRSRHIYILSAAMVHLALGCYLSPVRAGFPRLLQCLGSALLLIAGLALVIAFFREPPRGKLAAPFSGYGVIILLVGTLCHVVASAVSRRIPAPD